MKENVYVYAKRELIKHLLSGWRKEVVDYFPNFFTALAKEKKMG